MAKIVVMGGAGHFGTLIVDKLNAHGHEAIPASRRTGVDVITGQGLAERLTGVDVVVDATQSPSFAPGDLHDFFTTSATNLLAAEKEAGVDHHVYLTVVGTNRPQNVPYFNAKAAAEDLIRASGIGYSIIHATQVFEFVNSILATSKGDEQSLRITNALIQPVDSDDVAEAVARASAGRPLGDIEVAGPDVFGMDEMLRHALLARGDERTVTTDPEAHYFGARLAERTLLPIEGAQISPKRYSAWLAASSPKS